MNDFDWIIKVDLLEKPWILILNKDLSDKPQHNGVVHDWLFKNGYKKHNGSRTIDKSLKMGLTMNVNDKYFTVLHSIFSGDHPEKYKDHNIYFWEDLKDDKVVVHRLNLRKGLWNFYGTPEIYYTFRNNPIVKREEQNIQFRHYLDDI